MQDGAGEVEYGDKGGDEESRTHGSEGPVEREAPDSYWLSGHVPDCHDAGDV